MKGLYDVARHLVWLTQFGLSVVVPLPALLAAGAGPAGPPRQKRRRKNISYIL